ncbi:hypothetical protein K3495_g15219 [Podosphaera aphanis]|nr:hypothetical protein K3495_g15219 [Podosphaera aphanis]
MLLHIPYSPSVPNARRVPHRIPISRVVILLDLIQNDLKKKSYSLRRRSVTPKKACDRTPSLSSEDVDKIGEFIKESPENRQMIGPLSSGFPFFGQMKLGQQMATIRDAGLPEREERDIHCIVEKIKKRIGWKFWVSFAGSEKCPSQFWEKDWGNTTSLSYSKRIVPLLHGMTRFRPGLSVIQDNAPPYVAARTMEEVEERSITPIDWSPSSPDVNPIEHVWKIMKDKIEFKYPDLNGSKRRSD